MSHRIPTAEQQLAFLQKVQRLLDEGGFTATYKYALLLALADLAVEKGDVGGAPLTVTSREIAEKFIQYYWNHAVPYPGNPGAQGVLRQNTDRQAAVVNAVEKARSLSSGSMARLKADPQLWAPLVAGVSKTVREMPLWRLQTFAHGVDDFLYPHAGDGHEIELRPGIAYCLRAFHGQLVNMVQGAWVRWLRRLDKNQPILGQAVDLHEFLFGSERAPLAAYAPLLLELQGQRCFYCGDPLKGAGEVDHFIPWARYPVDLGHNFVLAHKACNGDKSDLLAAEPHLERWVERNDRHGDAMVEYFLKHDLPYDLDATRSVACWAYEQVEAGGGDVWLRRKRVAVRLSGGWRGLAR